VDEDQQWRSWVDHLVKGDDRVVREFWDEYGHRLQGFAAKLLNRRFYRREEPDDVVQSVCRTFVRRARAGQFELASRDSLWRLLCAITAAKTRQKVRFHDRQTRAAGREHKLPTDPNGGAQVAGPEPTPAEEVAFADYISHLLANLDEDQRRVVEFRLQGYQYKEIAEKTGIAYRTVKRSVQRIREKWQGCLEESDWRPRNW
jgi:RNA polymerase sigma factor (sigma-70 family)